MTGFYGPYLVPYRNLKPGLEEWLRSHVPYLGWRVHVNENDEALEFYFKDAEIGTLFALIWG